MRYRHRVLLLLFLLSIITYLDRVCIAVAGPRMQADLGIGPEWWGWVVGVFAISYAAFEIPSGSMGDRIGPRKVLTRIVLWWSAFTTLTGFAANVQMVVPIRARYGWRASFYVFGVLGVVWAAVWYRWYRDRPAQMAAVCKAELEEIGDPP